MNLVEVILLCAVNMAAFFIGAKVGQKVVKGEEIKLPNPVDAIHDHKSRKEADRIMERDNIILANIDRYDGTGFGQQDVPKG